MQKKEYEIFISYRREGGADKARILKTELESRGYKIFLDFDELKEGVFDKRIMDAIDSSPIFMFLLTPNSLERCVNEDDWVRKEIEYAVDTHKHIIPINPNCTFKSLPDNLSDKIKEGLGQHLHIDVMFGQLFKASINELINNSIRPILAKWGRENAAATKGATIYIETDLDCRILRFGREIGLAQAGEYSEVKIPKGKHKLEFVGLENAADKYEHLLTVEDIEFEDYIEVKLLDKYNARKAKEEAKRKAQEEAEREAREKAERNTYLLGLPDEMYEWFTKSGKYGCRLATTQSIVIPAMYNFADSFCDGLAIVKRNGKFGFVDKTGKEVIPLKYDITFSFREGLTRVKLNGKFGFIDKTGKNITSLIYEDAGGFSQGLASVKLNNKWGFIDETGKEVIPLMYDEVKSFSEDLAAVRLYNKGWGFIDKTGNEVILLRYEYVNRFVGEKNKVILNGEWFYIDKNGNRIKEE